MIAYSCKSISFKSSLWLEWHGMELNRNAIENKKEVSTNDPTQLFTMVLDNLL